MSEKYVIETVAKRIIAEIVWSPDPGAELRKWRETFKVTQAQLAKQMGIKQSSWTTRGGRGSRVRSS